MTGTAADGAGPTPPPTTGAWEEFLSWASSALAALIREWRYRPAWTFVGATLGVVVALAIPSQYTTSASFIAQGSQAPNLPSALQGFAATVGLLSSRDFSPQFYADLTTSRPVLLAALQRRYAVPGGGMKTYAAIEGLGEASPRDTDAALRQLGKRIATRADVRTNIVTIEITARYPQVSRDLAAALLEGLDSLNVGFRQLQSREMREFFEGRVRDAQHELDQAEATLEDFLVQNRVAQTPLLQFQQQRLARAADLKRSVYMTVVQQYEEARIQESRNVPILTILAEPYIPTRKSGPPRRLIVVLFAAFGFAAGFMPRGWRRLVGRFARAEPEAHKLLQRGWARLLHAMTRPRSRS